jgi:REP element-mobilizing transposase RayT
MWYHALNRGNRREAVFLKPGDYDAFVKAIGEACQRLPVDVLCYCLMPNHFHLLLRPHQDGDLGRWMQWLLTAHAVGEIGVASLFARVVRDRREYPADAILNSGGSLA